VHVHPQSGEKNLGPNLQGKVVSAPPGRVYPPRQSKSLIFGGNWGDLDGGRGYLGSLVLACFESDD